MEHVVGIDQVIGLQPVNVLEGTSVRRTSILNFNVEVLFRKTRSTIAVDASDLSELNQHQTVHAMKYLMGLCKLHNREEVVIENLETLPRDFEIRSVRDCYFSLQSDITQASQMMKIGQPRVALEKRRQHYDLRIYPNRH